MPSRRYIILTGAPDAESLKWTEGDLVAPLLPCFSPTTLSIGSSLQATHTWPVWRSIQLERQHLSTGLTPKAHEPDFQDLHSIDNDSNDETSFLDIAELSFTTDYSQDSRDAISSSQAAEETLSKFYKHSFAIHEELPSSQIIDVDISNDTSFMTASSDYLSSQDLSAAVTLPDSPTKPRPTSGNVSDLEDIPNAAYLRSINPQTMTVNLIVGIIAMPQPRTIKARKSSRILELIEMTVGDETKAGFGINLWLPPLDTSVGGLRNDASDLRPQDVILVRNVALSSFRDNIYGQSLRKGLTKLDLLHRIAADKSDRRGAYSTLELNSMRSTDSQMAKVKRVRDWVMSFVGAGASGLTGREIEKVGEAAKTGERELLPLDTQ